MKISEYIQVYRVIQTRREGLDPSGTRDLPARLVIQEMTVILGRMDIEVAIRVVLLVILDPVDLPGRQEFPERRRVRDFQDLEDHAFLLAIPDDQQMTDLLEQ